MCDTSANRLPPTDCSLQLRAEADMAPEPKKGKSNARMDAGKAGQLVEAIKKEQRCCVECLQLASKLQHVHSSCLSTMNLLKDHAQIPGGAGEGWADQAPRGAQSGNS